jgi:hypothetical protein
MRLTGWFRMQRKESPAIGCGRSGVAAPRFDSAAGASPAAGAGTRTTQTMSSTLNADDNSRTDTESIAADRPDAPADADLYAVVDTDTTDGLQLAEWYGKGLNGRVVLPLRATGGEQCHRCESTDTYRLLGSFGPAECRDRIAERIGIETVVADPSEVRA